MNSNWKPHSVDDLKQKKKNDSDDADDDGGGAVRTITFMRTGQCSADDARKANSKETTNQFNYSLPTAAGRQSSGGDNYNLFIIGNFLSFINSIQMWFLSLAFHSKIIHTCQFGDRSR